MRQSLMRTFDDIYVLDLHGNALKRETCPDGSKDENVFDIRQGVAIAFFVKRGEEKKTDLRAAPSIRANALVRHSEIWGLRRQKYDWLIGHDLKHTDWRELKPESPFYLFVPRDNALEAAYRRHPSVPELFPANSVGIVTARDGLTIHWSPDAVWKTVTVFCRMDPELARQGYNLGKDAQDWKVTLAQKDLLESGPTQEKIVPVLYRPFDLRHTYYTGRSRGFMCRPRPEIMRHMLAGENLAMCVGRAGQVVGGGTWSLAFCSAVIEDFNLFYRGGNVNLPLYSYPESDRADLFTRHESSERRPNLNPKIVEALAHAYRKQPSPEDIFHYVYAVLYAPTYREKYAEFLRMDFPRIPFTSDAVLFVKLAALGKRLTDLHLLRSPELDPPTCRFEGDGDNRMAKGRKEGLRYESAEHRVWINKIQYFAPVLPEVWTYQVGGYQVCEKWLKDRAERRLEHGDVRAYCSIVTSLKLTIGIQKEIDRLYAQAEIETVPLAESLES